MPELTACMRRLGLPPPSREILHRTAAYLRELEKWRSKINLMGRCNSEELIRLHFCEAFWAAERFLAGEETLADVGSGAGFPGLAMKLYRPRLRVALLERTRKKCAFLGSTARSLGLDVSVVAVSAEDWSGWEPIDFASVRAVRLGPVLLERLRRADVALLHFRGAHPDPALAAWELIREEAYPLGKNRWVSLYRAPRRID